MPLSEEQLKALSEATKASAKRFNVMDDQATKISNLMGEKTSKETILKLMVQNSPPAKVDTAQLEAQLKESQPSDIGIPSPVESTDSEESAGGTTQHMGYACPACDSLFIWDSHRASTAWYCGDSNISEDECIYVECEPVEENVWRCGDDCFNHDQGDRPERITVWECNECEYLYDNLSDAQECCT